MPGRRSGPLFRPVHSALLPSLCATARELAGANVVRGALDSAATLAGPLLTAVLLATGALGRVLVLAALASAWAAVLMARVRPGIVAVEGTGPSEGPVARTLGGLRAVGAQRDLRLIFGLIGVQTFMRGAVTVFTVVVAIELVGLGEAGVGALGAYLGARARWPRRSRRPSSSGRADWGGGSAYGPRCGVGRSCSSGSSPHPRWPRSCSPPSARATR